VYFILKSEKAHIITNMEIERKQLEETKKKYKILS